MEVQVSIEVDRPISEVWRWYALDQVRNHPRWDPEMELEQITEGAIGLGTRIRRRNTRWGKPVEGEMEVVEFEPERALGMSIRDENMTIGGRATFEALAPDRTLLTISAIVPGLDDEKAAFMRSRMKRSAGNIKDLLEAET